MTRGLERGWPCRTVNIHGGAGSGGVLGGRKLLEVIKKADERKGWIGQMPGYKSVEDQELLVT